LKLLKFTDLCEYNYFRGVFFLLVQANVDDTDLNNEDDDFDALGAGLEEDDEGGGGFGADGYDENGKKLGKKKMAKLEEKANRREKNEEMAREREERKTREEELYQARKEREREEERKEKEKEELERKLKEEQEKREHEEYLKLKEQFTVEEVGQDAENDGESEAENLLIEFVEFIKRAKIMPLENLAAEFKLKTQDAIDRIRRVEEMGRLTGVMDDRGKYIYVQEEELMNVREFIRQRGRINIGDLADYSSKLVNLKPSSSATASTIASA
jgi:hypothetical protein